MLVEHRDAIRAVAARRRVRSIALTGSVARGEDTADSDYDFLIDCEPGVGLLSIAGLQRELQEILGEAVDVVPETCIKDSHRGMLKDAVVL